MNRFEVLPREQMSARQREVADAIASGPRGALKGPFLTIVSESFARRVAGGGAAIGRRVAMPGHRPGHPPDEVEVIGVVDDVVTRVSVLEPLDMYFPVRQSEPSLYRTLIVRASAAGDGAAREILGAIKAVDPAVAPAPVLSLADRIGRQMAPQRFGAMVLGESCRALHGLGA